MNIAVIPARGGSKRIPRKNIREFCGQPMIAYAIIAAIKSGIFDRIVVSTDDDEIARIAEAHGAEAPFRRSPELANDHTGILEVIQDAIRRIGVDRGCVAAILPTVPLLKASDLREAYQNWNQHGPQTMLIPVCQYAYPVFRSFTRVGETGLKMLFPECYPMRSQDLEPVFHDAALFYFAAREVWLESDRIYRTDAVMMIMPGDRVCDIDTPEDWDRAEFLVRWHKNRGGSGDA
jgi:N-acylneuraminate cytidylyltransferase